MDAAIHLGWMVLDVRENKPMAEYGSPNMAAAQGMRAWQEGLGSLMRAWTPAAPALNGEAVQDGVNRIISGLSELTSAQVAVAAGWVQLPFALASGNSNGMQDLQRGYARLFQAYNGLFQAYSTAAAPLRRAAADTVERTIAASANATQNSATVARSAIDAAGAQAEAASRATANNATHAASAAVDQAIRIAEAAQSVTPKSARGSGTIKGKIGRDGSRIYHMPGQANYDRFDADLLFESEAEAQAAGFRASQR
jgi:hypothetical protein